jgi:hypothetical protein
MSTSYLAAVTNDTTHGALLDCDTVQMWGRTGRVVLVQPARHHVSIERLRTPQQLALEQLRSEGDGECAGQASHS